ncbi:MAG: response regulator transcription factor [Chthoniobacter sp.]|uniref:response regulator transcription factor n=1 Tax=Chthoniobacter sp. TaxID=2510640 RepID=UPI0032A9F1AB
MSESSTEEKKKILIVEDHPLFRAMLVQLIENDLEMTVCGETDNIKDALALVEKTMPDAALVDITLQGSSGLELIKDLRARDLHFPVLVVSMHEEQLYAERVLRAGARGYISKQEPPLEVVKAIRSVIAGRIYVSERVTGSILEKMDASGKTGGPAGIEVLSDREIEVFQLVGRGLNSREIAQRINLGMTTVDTYRQRIREKLGIRNAAELYQRAVKWVTETGV